MSQIAHCHLRSLATPWQGTIHSGQHVYATDKPVASGGQDSAPAPYDYLLASLAACTMMTLRMYAQHK